MASPQESLVPKSPEAIIVRADMPRIDMYSDEIAWKDPKTNELDLKRMAR